MAQTVERPPTGSVTITIQEPQNVPVHTPTPEVVTLRLAPRRKKKVSWQPGTVDNEFMNKKSSKKCCIFHKNKSFDEDDSDGDDDCCGGKKPQDQGKGKSPCNSAAGSSSNCVGGEGSSSHCCSHSH